MTYFNHYEVTPDMGLREAINTILATDCVTGDGIEKESNYYELEAWGLKSLVPADVRWSMGNTGSHATAWKLAPKVTSDELREIIDACASLHEYVLLNDVRYNDMCWEQGRKLLESEAQYAGVDPEVFIDVATNKYDVHFYSEDGGVTYDMSKDTFEAILDETKQISQTSHAHYYAGQYHDTSICGYCEEFPELVGSRAE